MKNSRIRFCGREGMRVAYSRRYQGGQLVPGRGPLEYRRKLARVVGAAPETASTEMAKSRIAPDRSGEGQRLPCCVSPQGIALGCQGSALTGAKLYLKQGEPERGERAAAAGSRDRAGQPGGALPAGARLRRRAESTSRWSESFNRSLELSEEFRPQIEELRRRYWTSLYNQGVERATAEPPDFSQRPREFVQGWRPQSTPELTRRLAQPRHLEL